MALYINVVPSSETTSSIQIEIGGLGKPANQYSYFRVEVYEGSTLVTDQSWTSSSTGSYTHQTVYGLKSGTTYRFDGYVRSIDSDPEYNAGSTYGTTKKPRPNNFSWSTSKVSGIGFNVTASDWNNLCSRINEFRLYKSIGEYSFTTAYKGYDFTASKYNEARYAISEMNPYVSVPPYRNSGDFIYANDLNTLVSSLNSIT